MKENVTTKNQSIILEQRRNLRATGVKDIDFFSETKIVLNTCLGELVVRGTDLHVISLITEMGELTLNGKINSLTYNDTSSNANLFKRMFR